MKLKKKCWTTARIMLKSTETKGSERFKPVQCVKKETSKRLTTLNAFERECFDSQWVKSSLENECSPLEILPEGLFYDNYENVVI